MSKMNSLSTPNALFLFPSERSIRQFGRLCPAKPEGENRSGGTFAAAKPVQQRFHQRFDFVLRQTKRAGNFPVAFTRLKQCEYRLLIS